VSELRKISCPSGPHNAAARAGAACGLVLLLALAGCGSDKSAPGQQAAAAADTCAVAVDLSGWEAFRDLATRITAGGPVDEDALGSLADQPAFRVWRESLAPNDPDPIRLRNWVEATFPDELGLTGQRKANPDRQAIAASWRWSWEHRAAVDSVAARFAAGDGPCGILAAAAGFVDRDRIPRPLPVYVLPGKPELRWTGGRVVVDTGVLVAGDLAQLDRQVASLIYRNVQAEEGPNPLGEAGEDAVYGTFRIVRNEGVASWIEDLPHTVFSPDHPRLRRVHPVPENYYGTTVHTLDVIAERLPALLADPAAMMAGGEDFARTVAAGGGLLQGGYGMAALIAARLGEERLQAVSHSVPDFFAAYQEAALRNGDDRPAIGALGHQSWEALGPFPPDVYDGLIALLKRHAPAS